MKANERDLMERYIYEVTRRVPSGQREEIKMELQELIEEMHSAKDADMEGILSKLGDPAEFAKKYRDDKNYVISPEYYDNYVWVLKIVLICVAGASVLSGILSFVMSSVTDGSAAFGVENNIISALIWAFGMVTLVFAVLERFKVKVDLKNKKEWHVEELNGQEPSGKAIWTPSRMAPVPAKKALISRGETVVGIVFIVIFTALLIFAPQLLGAYIIEDSKLVGIIPIFNLNEWGRIMPVLAAGMFISLLDGIVRLITGCYCKLVLISNLIACVLQVVLAYIALKVLPIWNLSFAADTAEQFGKSFTSGSDILHYWGTNTVSNIILLIIIAATILEAGTTIYRTTRYAIQA